MDGTLENDIRAVVDADRAHVWHHLTQHKPFETADPRIIIEGKGMRVWDQNGKEYLDAVSGGVWTVNVGYGREQIADAVRDQIMKLCYFAQSAGSVPGSQFAEKLIEKMPGLSRVYYTNSGSEANEKAFKMIRQIAHKKYGGKKHKILYRDRDYHGGTLATMSAGGQDERGMQYGPFAPGFVRVPHCMEYRKEELGLGHLSGREFGIAAANLIEDVILREGPDTIGGLCLEPVTAGGGVITPPEGYWERVQEICKKYDILLHIDEVVCGIGRTGTHWFGYQHYGIKPDFVTMAKGVASGYAAIAICVTTEEVFEMFKSDPTDKLDHFRDISTFGGCTAGPAAALENMKIIEDEHLLDNCTQMGARLMANFEALKEKHEIIGDVRGLGLFQGIELVADRASKAPFAPADKRHAQLKAAAFDEGLICYPMGGTLDGKRGDHVLLAPPFIISDAQIEELVDKLAKALDRALPA